MRRAASEAARARGAAAVPGWLRAARQAEIPRAATSGGGCAPLEGFAAEWKVVGVMPFDPYDAVNPRRERPINQCPDSEVRIVSRSQVCELRNHKDTSKTIDLVWLWFRSPHRGLAALLMRTSELPH